LTGKKLLGLYRRGKNAFATRRARILVLYGALTLLGGVIVVRAIAPLAVSLIQQWSQSGVELRAQQIFNSIRPDLMKLLPAGQTQAIARLFESVAQNEGVLAAGFCTETEELQFPTKQMPPGFSCQQVARSETQSFSSLFIGGRQMAAASFPVPAPGAKGHLITLNAVSYSDERGARARSYLSLIVGGIILLSATMATLAALIVVQWRLSKLRNAVSEAAPARDFDSDDAGGNLPTAELLKTLRRLSPSRAEMDDEQSIWSAERLRALIRDELPGTDIIAVSNREPYIHNRTDDGIELQIPASGLVTALEPVMQACGGTWIAHGGGSADRETVDSDGRLLVPPAKPSYTLRRVWLSDEEQDGYYYGLANEGLWPLCHIAFVQPTFRQEDWHTYRTVNQRFADAIVREARSKSPIVLIHDYHFALLPRMVLEQLPEATIITFWHIPWPNSETFGICPWKEEVIKGMLGSSILGFHTHLHCNNFLYTVDRFMESRIDHDYASVTLGGHETLVRPYPISIAWPPAGLAEQKPVSECRAAVRSRLGLTDNVRLAVGVERFDYTKGICERMRAVDAFLTQRPEWRGKFVFLQAAAPTRGKLGAYHALQDEAMRLAEEINAGYDPLPINLAVRYHEPHEVFELLRAADVCIVSSLHDGMNLVAKEFVAARDDERGVLILSRFAGASRELPEALIVNPYDSHGMSATIQRALTMTEEEQQERMRAMRELVRSRNVYRWAGQMLLDASRLRNRQRIMRIATKNKSKVRLHG
jgi:trehalose 6-phosphate synthase